MAQRYVREYKCDRCGKKEYIEVKFASGYHYGNNSALLYSPPNGYKRVAEKDICGDCYTKFMEFMNALGRCEKGE